MYKITTKKNKSIKVLGKWLSQGESIEVEDPIDDANLNCDLINIYKEAEKISKKKRSKKEKKESE